MTESVPGQLVLKSGALLKGRMPSYQTGPYFGEVVFTTGMTGYVESLTDPSFAGQILTFTFPMIGNYGVPDPQYFESTHIHARGVIVSQAITHFSHHEAKQGLLAWLKAQNVPILFDVDTRALTKILRDQGVALGAIQAADAAPPSEFPDPNLEHLVQQVSCSQSEIVVSTQPKGFSEKSLQAERPYQIIAVDCGMKMNILRHLQRFPFHIKRVPFDYDFSEEECDGVFISNGPGDPTRCVETIRHVQQFLTRSIPIFGICLGAQILGLAIGAKTYKLPFGHRGQNQPCQNLETGQAVLTSQNHGYAIDEASLPKDWRVSFRHLNDKTVAGIAHTKQPYFAVQFHPESAPGPHDTEFLFEQFYRSIHERK